MINRSRLVHRLSCARSLTGLIKLLIFFLNLAPKIVAQAPNFLF